MKNQNKNKKGEKMTDSVKIDKQLLERVKELIKKNSKKIKYSSAKQFVNIAVLEMLESEK